MAEMNPDARKKLYLKANRAIKKSEFGEAIECYDKVAALPGLNALEWATCFEKRSKCHLKLAHFMKERNQDGFEIECDKAIADATVTMELHQLTTKFISD